MEKALFTIEGEIVVEGIHNPHSRWNGWAMPLLPLSSVVKVAEWLESIGADPADGGIPKVIDGVPHWVALDEMTETFTETLRMVPVVIDGIEYFEVGTGGWCWDEYTPACEACSMLEDEDREMTDAEIECATNLCGDCEAFFGLGGEFK